MDTIKVIMHGCNGKMGQTISGLIAADEGIEIAAGIDAFDDGHNAYPVFTDIDKCDVAADALIDFSCPVFSVRQGFPRRSLPE